MGGKPAPAAPTVVMPSPTAPTLFQSVVPLQSYKDLAETMKRYQEETGKIQEQRYQEVGTPAQIGALAASRRVQEEAARLRHLLRGAGAGRGNAHHHPGRLPLTHHVDQAVRPRPTRVLTHPAHQPESVTPDAPEDPFRWINGRGRANCSGSRARRPVR
mgnify:CR=1 FL=1